MRRKKDEDDMYWLDEKIKGVSTYDLFMIHKYMKDNDLKKKRKIDRKKRRENMRNE